LQGKLNPCPNRDQIKNQDLLNISTVSYVERVFRNLSEERRKELMTLV